MALTKNRRLEYRHCLEDLNDGKLYINMGGEYGNHKTVTFSDILRDSLFTIVLICRGLKFT